jgi:DNA-binding response OmpR family regulator
LVVEDDRDIAHLIELNLRDVCDTVDMAHDGVTGLARAESQAYDLIILDLRLPGLDGLELCRQLRGKSNHTPILMLTAKSSELDRVLGLEMGADDYLTKPFSIMELIARVRAILRRAQIHRASSIPSRGEILRAGQLIVDTQKRQVTLETIPVELTAKEFDLLAHFIMHPGRVYTRLQLLDTVWGYGHDGYEHTVNSHINRLRAKIETNPAAPRYILTVWGVGYKFADLDTAAD